VRIFESDFYLDAAQQMDRIWQALDDLGIERGQIGTDDFIEADNTEIIESVSEWSGRNAHADNIDLVTSLPGYLRQTWSPQESSCGLHALSASSRIQFHEEVRMECSTISSTASRS